MVETWRRRRASWGLKSTPGEWRGSTRRCSCGADKRGSDRQVKAIECDYMIFKWLTEAYHEGERYRGRHNRRQLHPDTIDNKLDVDQVRETETERESILRQAVSIGPFDSRLRTSLSVTVVCAVPS